MDYRIIPIPFTRTGGARIGWVNATYPFATLSATPDKLVIAVFLLGTYSFLPEEICSIDRYGFIPVFASGIRVRHTVSHYPQSIIFWYLGNPQTILNAIRDSGFVVKGNSEIPARRGIPLRWSAIIVIIAVWNVFFFLTSHTFSLEHWPSWLVLIPFYTGLALAVGIPRSKTLQTILLKPGRHIGEIRPFLNLLAVVCGILAFIFTFLMATGEFGGL